MIGEWLALLLANAAGSQQIGDAISEAFLYPVAHRLIMQCDAIYRIPGESNGADKNIEVALRAGLNIYYTLDTIPQVSA